MNRTKISFSCSTEIARTMEIEIKMRNYKNTSQFIENALRAAFKEPWRVDAMLHQKYKRMAELYGERTREAIELQEEERGTNGN